jgi:curli production assembly/transport component CsgG
VLKKIIAPLCLALLLGGCATGSAIKGLILSEQFAAPKVEDNKFLKKKENKLLPPAGGPIPVAVYGFQDKTGQRKSVTGIASLSSAVTQGAESYLIESLQTVGDQRWFTVVERVGLDNLIKERQMIRQAREQFQGRDAKPLPPMIFAGVIIEGGIIGYDSNLLTGGSGMRVFGIGASTQYQSDTVTVTLRTVSVATGEILTTTTITKTVLSYMDKLTVLRFIDDPTNITTGAGALSVEGELGGSINESINKAVSVALDAAVINTIREGVRKGHWAFKDVQEVVASPGFPAAVLNRTPVVETVPVEPQPVIKPEPPKTDVVPVTIKTEEPAIVKPEPVKASEPQVPVPAKIAPVVEPLLEPTTTTEKTSKSSKSMQAVVTTFIRKNPERGGEVIGNLRKGEIIQVTESSSSGKYYLVVTNDGNTIGWVFKELLTAVKSK